MVGAEIPRPFQRTDQRSQVSGKRTQLILRRLTLGRPVAHAETLPARPLARSRRDLCPESYRYHQQYLHKATWGYCPDHGTGVSCPIGLGVATGTGVKAEPATEATEV